MIARNITYQKFLTILQSKELICFGAGRGFTDFCTGLDTVRIIDRVAYIVDNDSSKWGAGEKYGDRKKIIISPQEMCRYLCSQQYLLVITCMDFAAILDQLAGYHELDGMACYMYRCILDRYFVQQAAKVSVPQRVRITREQRIPKVIHYCWFGRNPLPERYRQWMASWRKYCPDYEIVEWNEDNYDVTKNRYMRQAYEAKKWGFVPDYARLDIIYEHGGIYLDTDVELLQGLDELLYQDGFCGFQYNQRVAFGLGFGAIAKLPILRDLRDAYAVMEFAHQDGVLNLTASPTYQTEALQKMGLIVNGEMQTVAGMQVYPATVLCGQTVLGESLVTKHTVAVHHYDGSWAGDKMKKNFTRLREL